MHALPQKGLPNKIRRKNDGLFLVQDEFKIVPVHYFGEVNFQITRGIDMEPILQSEHDRRNPEEHGAEHLISHSKNANYFKHL